MSKIEATGKRVTEAFQQDKPRKARSERAELSTLDTSHKLSHSLERFKSNDWLIESRSFEKDDCVNQRWCIKESFKFMQQGSETVLILASNYKKFNCKNFKSASIWIEVSNGKQMSVLDDWLSKNYTQFVGFIWTRKIKIDKC